MSTPADRLHQWCPVLAILQTAAVFGVEAYPVSVEVDVSDGGLPAMTMVGLPDASVRESRDRVQSAIRNSGFEFPRRHVTVNLSPADVRKVGSAFDLPIALGGLAATGLIPARQIDDAVVLGELSLDGGHTERWSRTCSSLSSSIAPPATQRPFSRMRNSLATLRANNNFCSTNMTVTSASLFNLRRMSPIS